MIWIAVLVTIALTGLLILKNEGGSFTEEPVVTATYMVWPLVLIIIAFLVCKDARKEAKDLVADPVPEPVPTPKDLN